MRWTLPILLTLWAAVATAGPRDPSAPLRPDARGKTVVRGASTNIGNLGLGITNLGWFGNLLNPTVSYPSFEWPLNSGVEHMFLAGLWVGGITTEADTLVSAGAEDTASNSGNPKLEFGPREEDELIRSSSNPLSPVFSTSALADQQFEMVFDDFSVGGGGPADDPHVPMGVRVHSKVLAYAPSYADDFVILLFEIENISGREINGLYVGFYAEMTVGNVAVTTPGSSTNGWNFYDDANGILRPGELPEDPQARLMYCHDADGEDGAAESWAGIRLLGADAPGDPDTGEVVFSYRQWRFGQMPRFDRDKYEFMSSGRIDEGRIEGVDYDAVGNWISMFATGPWPSLFPGDTANFAVAFVAGADSTEMLANSQVAQSTYDNGFELPAGPPSPRLSVRTENHRVILSWDPGTDPGDGPYDPTLASPEYHRSSFTNAPDFQGYRVWRIFGDVVTGDPFQQASLLAEYDVKTTPTGGVDPVGFNTGLPPMDENGRRIFVDDNVLDGFPYIYSVTSYAARDPRLGLPELESGFNENAVRVIPGSPAGGVSVAGGAPAAVGVYPNPYRGGGEFDSRFTTGEPRELGRQIWFTNVPARAAIDIYNLSGTRVDRIVRDDPSTGQVEWRLLSENNRALAPGLYVYVVEDLDSGDVQRGKLVILK